MGPFTLNPLLVTSLTDDAIALVRSSPRLVLELEPDLENYHAMQRGPQPNGASSAPASQRASVTSVASTASFASDAPPQAATQAGMPLPRSTRTAVLKRKTNGGFGFTILAETEQPSPLYVLSVSEGGIAAKSKKVFAGDRILSINGDDTSSTTQSKIPGTKLDQGQGNFTCAPPLNRALFSPSAQSLIIAHALQRRP